MFGRMKTKVMYHAECIKFSVLFVTTKPIYLFVALKFLFTGRALSHFFNYNTNGAGLKSNIENSTQLQLALTAY